MKELEQLKTMDQSDSLEKRALQMCLVCGELKLISDFDQDSKHCKECAKVMEADHGK